MQLLDLDQWARRQPDQPAVFWPDRSDDVLWTYSDFAARVAGVATTLAARQLPAGATVAVVGGNSPAWLLLAEACAWLRLTFVPISPRLTPAERDFLLHHSQAALVLGEPALPRGKVLVESWQWCEQVKAATWPERPANVCGQQLLYTSGSSGVPKGVLRARDSDDARIRQSIDIYGLMPHDHNLVAGPLYHSGPAIFYRMFRRLGARQSVLLQFDAQRVLTLLASGQITALFMVPTMWRMLLDQWRRTPMPIQLKHAFIAGSVCERELRQELLGVLGEGVLWEFYGATETGTITILPPHQQRSHAHSVGFPPPQTMVRIVDENGRDLPLGQAGRIYVKSPTTMLGYHRGPGTPADLREDILPGGWVSVGDRGYLCSDGALVLQGREQGMIISGGINIYPEEVEAALKKIAGVLEAVVVGVADRTWGQKVCALVEPSPQAVLSEQQLKEALRPLIAGYKIPKQIKIGPIPRTASEKLSRSAEIAKLFC